MLSPEKFSEVREKYKNTFGRKEITDEEFERLYPELVKNHFIPAPARYMEAKSDDLPKIILDNFPLRENEKTGIYLWGGVGAGKTHTLYAIKHFFAERLVRFRIINMTELLHEVKASFNTPEKTDIVEEAGYYEGYDDIGVEKDTEWAAEQTYRLVNKLYESKRPFVFTSNYSLKELAERYGDHGDRIASRLAEMAKVIELKGEDRRV